MQLSCAFAPTLDTPEHIELAERLGYVRAWCYDSPALYPDVWMILGEAAARTECIGLGPGVLVPSLRHPMVNAAAIATLEARAPGRVAVAIGAGFTGRFTLGQRPMRWTEVRTYVVCLRALLAGEETEWEGARIRMLQPAGTTAPRPVQVPILIGGDGPKGRAAATELADGLFAAALPPPDEASLPAWRALLAFGTVLGNGEDPTSERVVDAAGPALAVVYHGMYERAGEMVDSLPGGATWRAAIEAVPPEARHLAIHKDHLLAVTDRDRPAVAEGASLIPMVTFTGTADDLRGRRDALEAAGVTELVLQPAGRDIPGELARFHEALG